MIDEKKSKILETSSFDFVRADAFDFVKISKMKWIPCKDKRPLEAWKTDGKIYTPDDLVMLQKFRSQGVNQIGYPTEQNNLVVIDCDVVHKSQDERSNNPKYKSFCYGDNFMSGALNFVCLMYQKAKETNSEDLNNFAYQLCAFFTYGFKYGNFDAIEPFNCMTLTPTGGMHFYFKSDDAGSFTSNSSQLCEHVDIRAKGGIIIAPMSERKPEQKPNEKIIYNDAYLPLSDFQDIPPLPDALASLLPKAEIEEAQSIKLERAFIPNVTDIHAISKDARKFVKWQEAFKSEAVKGTRNSTLSKYIGRSFRLRTVTPSKVEDTFRALALAAGLKMKEINACINSAKSYADRMGVFAK